MKPPRFAYLAPRSVDEVLHALSEHGAEAKLLAGGQSLVPLLNFRLARPSVLIDLNAVAGLDSVIQGVGHVRFGAMVRQSTAERSELVQTRCPLLSAALMHVGHRAIRNRGTLGGSLAHADPAAELPLTLTALGGQVRLLSARGERWVAASDFFVSYLTTVVDADELLAEVRLPFDVGGWAFEEFSRRHGDFALAAVAVVLHADATGRVDKASLAVAGGGPTPVSVHAAADLLLGIVPSDSDLREVAHQAAQLCEVEGDLHASASYRRELIAVLGERALAAARTRLSVQGD